MISCPLQQMNGRTMLKELELLLQKGFSRVLVDGEAFFVEDMVADKNVPKGTYEILIDRVSIQKEDEDNQFRIADSVQTAFFEGHGECTVTVPDKGRKPLLTDLNWMG
jgi:excinuclease ABC subunit A